MYNIYTHTTAATIITVNTHYDKSSQLTPSQSLTFLMQRVQTFLTKHAYMQYTASDTIYVKLK